MDHVTQSCRTWTASRCRRLLRPLQARVTALRKQSLGKMDLVSPSCHGRPIAEKSTKRRGEEFTHGGRRKKPRRTYSQRQPTSNDTQGITASAQDTDQGNLNSFSTFPTARKPTLSHFTWPTPGRFASHDRRQQHHFREELSFPPKLPNPNALQDSLRSLRCAHQPCTESRLQLYEGILRDLDAIIKATATTSPSPNQKSLLSMCLRKVPAYIAGMQARDALQLPKDSLRTPFGSSACIRIYDELGQYGHGQKGWDHFPILTRANALWIIKEAAVDDLFEPYFSCIMIQYYITAGCQRDAMDLFREIVGRGKLAHQQINPRRGVRQLLSGMSILLEGSELDGTTPQLFREITPLILHDHHFVDRLLPEALGRMWTWVFESIHDPVDNVGALDFASAAIASLSLSFPRDLSRRSSSCMVQVALESTPLDIVGVITALSLSTGRGIVSSTGTSAGLPQRKVCYILRNAFNMSKRGASRIARYMLALALFVATSYPLSHDRDAQAKALELCWQQDTRFNESNKDAQFYSITAALGCSIAQYSGKITSIPPSYYFSEFCDQLDTLRIQALGNLRKDGAFLLAQRTHDLRDLAFAETLCESTDDCSARIALTAEDNPLLSPSHPGYRWETGISEWVIASPLGKRPPGSRTAT